MKVIVVGLGQTGTVLADQLAREMHDVVVVDDNREKVEAVTAAISVSGVSGSGVSRSVLLKAGADTADVVLALTPIDEVNLMICRLAKTCGTRYGAARIFRPELSEEREEIAKEFLADYLINPKVETAREMMEQIGLPAGVSADAFFDGKAAMIRVPVEQGMFTKEETPIYEVKTVFGADVLVGTVMRGEEIFIPKGDFVVKTGDVLGILGSDTAIRRVVEKLGIVKRSPKKICLVGGGDLAYYLAKDLLAQKKSVSILEQNKKRCGELLEKLPEAKVSMANGLQADVLLEEGMQGADVCVSLTGSDETNLVVSLFAWSQKIPCIITKVNTVEYEKLLSKVNIDSTFSPSVITVDGMLGFVRNVAVYNSQGNDIQSVQQLAAGAAEAIEFIAYDNCKYLNIPFKSPDFKIKKELLIGMLIRGEECLIPDGESKILSGDHVVVFAKRGGRNRGLNVLDDIFRG